MPFGLYKGLYLLSINLYLSNFASIESNSGQAVIC